MSSPLVFQFWDNSAFADFGSTDQALLDQHFGCRPRPREVGLSNQYSVFDFDAVEYGAAYQVNRSTGFQRRVRLRPPFQIPGAPPPLAVGRVHFQYLDPRGGWQDFEGPTNGFIATQALNCSPAPAQVCFPMLRQLWCLTGLHLLARGGDLRSCPLLLVNLRTGATVRVRMTSSTGLAAGGDAASPSVDAVFRVEAGSRKAWRFPSPEVQAQLGRAWRLRQRPDAFDLCNGERVEGFSGLERDNAVLVNRHGQRVALELLLPAPTPGKISLPAEIDVDEVPFTSFGRVLRNGDVEAALRSSSSDGDRSCLICQCEMEVESGAAAEDDSTVFTLECTHSFHVDCLRQWFERKRRCPQCMRDYGKVFGTQPRLGSLEWRPEDFQLPGCPKATSTLIVAFKFPAGHDSNGQRYEKREPFCYLPGDTQGFLLLELYKIAFRRLVMFGLGTSLTLDTYRPTYNIHIKTSRHRGDTGHGFPDEGYFGRCVEELEANGVVLADLP
eukprot:TRINITY_DN37863_c0_g1_i2.p1 TRINITY_DN37863_c0_g1~~TRINITY_DN37863_c0_g1_i2.p1  ORF type:complete len:498 (-),score=84.09 TRINITY_DN37863_c0_g1_i2:58-1551(-)